MVPEILVLQNGYQNYQVMYSMYPWQFICSTFLCIYWKPGKDFASNKLSVACVWNLIVSKFL